MTDKFMTNLNFFLTEQQEDCFSEFRKENGEYTELRKHHAEDGNRHAQILESLEKKDMAFEEQYNGDSQRIQNMEIDRIYIQGYKDCIRLLNVFGVFENKAVAEE